VARIRAKDITVILIEHDMSFVMEVCNKIVVMENGAVIARGTPESVRRDQRVIEAYLGADED